ncbi:MAG: asparagine synthase-related protein [Thiotrichales bacterium]
MFLILSRQHPFNIQEQLTDLEQEVHVEFETKDYFTVGNYCGISWRKSTSLYLQQDFIYKDPATGDIALLQGYAWSSEGSSNPVTAKYIYHLLNRYSDRVDRVRDAINGEYAFVLLRETTLLAFNDQLGIENIYIDGQNNNRLCITNRMSLYAICNKNVDYDYNSLVYLPIIGYRFAEKTLYKNLSVLPQGAYLEVTPNQIKLHENPYFFLGSPSDHNLLLRGLDDCISYLERVFYQAEEIPLGITGGMDSRLVLALLLNTKLTDKIRLFTNGFPENPDVIVGKKIAAQLGLEHTNHIPSTSASPSHNAEEIISKLAIHAYQNEGMFGAWDLKAYPKAGNRIVLTGFAGELLKGYCKSSYDYINTPDAEDFIPRQGLLDPLQLLNQPAKVTMQQELRERVRFYLASGCENNDVPDIFYLKERIPNWLGAARRIDSYSDQGINPLNSQSLIQYAFSLTARQRQICLVHYQSLTELNPQLLEIPFASQKWHSELQNYGAKSKIFKEPVTAKHIPASNKPWQFSVNHNQSLRETIIQLIKTIETPLATPLSTTKLLAALQARDLSVKELISLYGFVTVFFKSSDFIQPQRVGLADKTTQSDHFPLAPLIRQTAFHRLNGGKKCQNQRPTLTSVTRPVRNTFQQASKLLGKSGLKIVRALISARKR